ncbi:MAG: Cof-type HAD-IIB family hydrolase [Turicibacter sp.]|nr:Cof-type HAD-IIB family hydrolase [Turicibacter sp.]
MKKKKLIVIDLDGTALHDHASIHPETKRALMKAKDDGHSVVIATGRPARGSLNFYRELGLDTPIINFNGAYMHAPGDSNFEEVVEQISLDRAMDIFNSPIREDLVNAVCEYKDHLYILKRDESLTSWMWMDEVDSITYGDFQETLDRNPSGFILQAKPGREQQVMSYLREHFSDIVACRNWSDGYQNIIEVFKHDINKGTALAILAERLGFHVEDIIVFGDGDNDIEMLTFAGTGVAMGNALEELKAIADAHALSNKEGGIAHYLYEHVLNP